ncbi:hypothetical protein NZ698_19055 [Chryseobacterium sp. PBS4-4]|uniref:Uncharacterized protein n=1 Tax=Chryseobacterium edaphi TaxID=2976532 RepID=A0ABT2WAQ0_9FLAO|nr:hypothetical protein [Chryseobacterium edaphi]MCU7619284.1 hypothetical protein [Chryseobacterium edaphi]
MEVSLFQIIILIIFVAVVFYIWFRYKIQYIGNFFIGGIILIFLSNLNFLGFEGKIGALSIFLIGSFYILLNISISFIYLFKDKKKIYFVFPTIAFLIILLFEFFFVDPNAFVQFKLGIAARLFISFFPLLIFTYYLKFLKK